MNTDTNTNTDKNSESVYSSVIESPQEQHAPKIIKDENECEKPCDCDGECDCDEGNFEVVLDDDYYRPCQSFLTGNIVIDVCVALIAILIYQYMVNIVA